jgi:hypothetical protein
VECLKEGMELPRRMDETDMVAHHLHKITDTVDREDQVVEMVDMAEVVLDMDKDHMEIVVALGKIDMEDRRRLSRLSRVVQDMALVATEDLDRMLDRHSMLTL